MSRSVDLFIDVDASLEELADGLGRLLGSRLVAEVDRPAWLLKDGEAGALLVEHQFHDDGDLLFTRYRFALSAQVSNQARPYDTAEAGLLRRVAQKIQQGPAWPVLLVHDLQYRERLEAAGSPGDAGVVG
jgi:hypothetical protein